MLGHIDRDSVSKMSRRKNRIKQRRKKGKIIEGGGRRILLLVIFSVICS